MNRVTMWVTGFFSLGITAALFVFVLDVFKSDIFTGGTYAYNITDKFMQGINEMAAQVPNAGKILGIGLIIAAFALLGVGGYMGYQRVQNR